MVREEPSNEVHYASIALIIFMYSSAIFTYIEIRKFVAIINFNDDFFKCRQPLLNISYIIAFLFVLYVLNPMTLFLFNIYGITSTIPLLVNDIADILIFCTFFPRAWILWFDRAFVDNYKNWLWRREVNPKDANCIVRYRQTLKHSHILVYSVYILLVAPIFTVLHILPYYDVYPFISHLTRAALLVMMLILTVHIVSTISIVSDEWNIRPELLASVKTTGVAYIVAHIFYVTLYYLYDEQWALLVELFFISIADLFVIYYTCHWTRHKFIFRQKLRVKQQLKPKGSFHSFLNKKIKLHQVMAHKHGVEAFCNHLVKEFGLESILFLLEVTQFKAIIRKISNGILTDNMPKLCNLRTNDAKHRVFSAESILNRHWLPIDPRMFTLTPYKIGLHLYDKYVEESADLCINISFENRRGIYRYFQELAQEENIATLREIELKIQNGHSGDIEFDANNPMVRMYHIFDDAFQEIWKMIQKDSFLRFQSTEEFRRLISVLFPEEATIANKALIKVVDEEIKKEIAASKKQRKQRKQSEQSLAVQMHPMTKLRSTSSNTLMPLPSLRSTSSGSNRNRGFAMPFNNDLAAGLTSMDESAVIDIDAILDTLNVDSTVSPGSSKGLLLSISPPIDRHGSPAMISSLPTLQQRQEQRSLPLPPVLTEMSEAYSSLASHVLRLQQTRSLPNRSPSVSSSCYTLNGKMSKAPQNDGV